MDLPISYHDIHYTLFNSSQSYEGILNINVFLEEIIICIFYLDDLTYWNSL